MNNTGLCAVVLAAGYGTRLRPLTEIRPKSLCPINNVPLLDLALDSVRPFADDIAVNVHYLAEQVIAHLDRVAVTISDERALILGSAGALGLLREWING
ncbi:MAG: NTP transferase domain-containing protein, partial [Actinomycetes bacterium]